MQNCIINGSQRPDSDVSKDSLAKRISQIRLVMLANGKFGGIVIPKGVKYLSEIPNLLEQLPSSCLLDKGKTGCGATTLVLVNNTPAIVCEFTQHAVRAKAEALPHTLGVLEGVSTKEIHTYLATCEKEGRVPKFICTIDSFPRLIESIEAFIKNKKNAYEAEQLLTAFHYDTLVVIDEVQRLLQWGSFKSLTFYKTLELLAKFTHVICLSATLTELRRWAAQVELEPLSNLPLINIEWEEEDEYIIQPIKTKRPLDKLRQLIQMYKEENYPTLTDEEGNPMHSKELLIYCNSVTDMVNVALAEQLPAEQCNFIVARNERNELLLSKAGMGYTIGHVPTKGEPSYKYTFITNVGFDVIDLYSDNALSVAVSTPCKIKALSIERDLIQLAGRQRNDKNPFRKTILFIYNVGLSYLLLKGYIEELKRQVEKDKKQAADLNNLKLKENKELIIEHFSSMEAAQNSFIRYSELEGKFTMNSLAEAAALQAVYTLANVYTAQWCLENDLHKNGFTKSVELVELKLSMNSLSMEINPPSFSEGLQRYCFTRKRCEDKNNMFSDIFFADELRSLERLNPKYCLAYEQLGFERCRALEYKEKKIDAELRDVTILAQQSIISEDKIVFEEVRQALLALPPTGSLDQKAKCRSIFASYGLDKQPPTLLAIARKYNLREKRSSSRPRLYSFIE